ncbi:MAG: two-component regulator propeller domain-containing protein [Bacteroidota bacterium]|nr:two-component regulator propeller domain-containing protein [Bacteroidota bacterium]
MPKFLVFLVVFLIFVLPPTFRISAQNSPLTFERVATDQGLTSNRINGIVQDQSGFLWIATNNGLNRYDGFENKQYTKHIDDTCSLSSNSVLSLFCDNDDQLWILTINYLHRYNKKLDCFERFLLSEKKESYRYENKGMITADPSGNIWIGTPTNGLFYFNKQNNTCVKVLPEINSVSSVFADQSGKLWIGSENGLLTFFDPTSKVVSQYRLDSGLRRLVNDDFIWKIWQNTPGQLNLFLTSGFFQFNIETGKFSELTDWNQKINYSNHELRSVFLDKEMIWVGTQGSGLYVVDLKNGKVSRSYTVSNNLNSLSNNSVTSAIKDQSGVYWIATKDGLNKYDPTMELFTHYQNEPGNPNSLHYNFVSSFCESLDGNIWVGTYGWGIAVFNRINETFKLISHIPGSKGSLVHNTVRALERAPNGNIWVATTNGLSEYNVAQKRFANFNSSKEKGSIASDDILSLLVSKDNRLFVGTNGEGVSVADLARIHTDGFKTVSPDFGLLSSGKVRKMIELNNGTIVFGTIGGGLDFLFQERITTLRLSDFSKSVDSDYVNALSEDRNKNVWVGTWDGLFLLDSTLQIRKQFSTGNGLPSNEITGIITDNNGDVWVSGMNGLSHLSPTGNNEYKISNYTARNGLQGSYFTTYSTLKTSDGELYFGGYNGFNRFYPEKITSNQKAPEVKLTDFQVFNQSVPINQKVDGRILLHENISGTKNITVNNRHRVIGFRFAAMTTSQIEKVKYACLMEGVDPDWVYLDYNQRFISYNNLSPGEYTFTVKACNADGVWDSEGTSVKIEVLPPFWKTWWAYILYAAIIVGLLYLAREYSLSRARLENAALLERVHREKDAEINNLKIKFFINISHEIRTPLSLIVAPLEKLLHTEAISRDFKKHLEIMYGNTQRLLTLINQLLDFRKIETGNVHLHAAPYDMVGFVSEIKNAFAESAARKDITLTLKSNIKVLPIWFDPDSMEKIMFNLLSNAIKFTLQGGSIQLVVNHIPEKMQCEILVRDSGIGVPTDKLEKLFDRFYQVDSKSFLKQDSMGSGIGLSIVKNLVELHKGEISVESTEGEFTQFRIVFKAGKTHLENNDYITISDEPIPYSINFRSIAPVAEDVETSEFLESDPSQKKKKDIKILIVEDNPEIRYYLKQSLMENYETMEAADGKIGYELAIQHIPDLIITDVMMPERDGIELCRMLKNEMLTQHIPIIILSAKSTIEDTLEGLETGADDYVPKPFNEQILLAKVRTLLANRQKLIEKYQLSAPSQNKDNEVDLLIFDDPFINRVIDFIRSNISDESLSNERIEAHFKTSKMQLYRKLKAVAGWSVNGLIREVRITEAKKLLKNPEFNISEIAYQLGFSDPLYFSKYFKKEIGVAPVQYRKDQLKVL